MDNITSAELIRDLFQLMKQFPRLRQKPIFTGGLTRSEYELLVMLSLQREEKREELTITEISNLLLITPAGVTHLVNSLEESGFIERLQSPRDRRVVRIDLTEKGIRLASSLMNEIQNQLVGLVGYLGEVNSRTLIRLLSRVNHYFASMSNEPENQ